MLRKLLQAYSPNVQEHTVGERKVRLLAPDAVEMMYQHFSSPLSAGSKMILPVSSVRNHELTSDKKKKLKYWLFCLLLKRDRLAKQPCTSAITILSS